MADTIKDFLATLAFKVDRESEAKFTSSLTGAVVMATALGAALEAATKAMAHAVADVATGLERVYYQAQRTNTTVGAIQAFTYGLTQFGTSSGAAASSVAAFGKAVTNNPGATALLSSLGVRTRDANGNLRDTTKLLGEFGQALQRFPQYQREVYARMLGVDYETMRALSDQPALLRQAAAEQARYAAIIGLNQEQAAKRGQEFMVSLRRLLMVVELVATKILSDLAPALQAFVDGITEWLAKNPDQVRDTIVAVADAAVSFAKALQAIIPVVTGIISTLGALSAAVGGHDGLLGAMEVFAAWMVGTWAVRIVAAIGGVSSAYGAMLVRLGILGGVAALAQMNNVLAAPERTGIAGQVEAWDPGLADMIYGKTDRQKALDAKDSRTMWQRYAPKALGGKDAPAGAGGADASAPGGEGATGATGALRIKSDESTGGGRHAPGIASALLDAQQGGVPGGFNRVTALNDRFHQGRRSMHNKGLAGDFTLNDPSKSAQAAEAMRNRLRAAGLADGDFKVIDEYRSPSGHATGGHIHVNFSSREAAARYQEAADAAREKRGATPAGARAAADKIAAVPEVKVQDRAQPVREGRGGTTRQNDVEVERETQINVAGSGKKPEASEMVLHGQKGQQNFTLRGIQGATR